MAGTLLSSTPAKRSSRPACQQPHPARLANAVTLLGHHAAGLEGLAARVMVLRGLHDT